MQITQSQMDHFKAAQVEAFLARLKRHMRQAFARECAELGDEVVQRNVADSIAAAAVFGLDSERSIVKFLEVTYLLHFRAPPPSLHAWAHRTLSSTDLDPVAKIDHVHERVRKTLAPETSESTIRLSAARFQSMLR